MFSKCSFLIVASIFLLFTIANLAVADELEVSVSTLDIFCCGFGLQITVPGFDPSTHSVTGYSKTDSGKYHPFDFLEPIHLYNDVWHVYANQNTMGKIRNESGKYIKKVEERYCGIAYNNLYVRIVADSGDDSGYKKISTITPRSALSQKKIKLIRLQSVSDSGVTFTLFRPAARCRDLTGQNRIFEIEDGLNIQYTWIIFLGNTEELVDIGYGSITTEKLRFQSDLLEPDTSYQLHVKMQPFSREAGTRVGRYIGNPTNSYGVTHNKPFRTDSE